MHTFQPYPIDLMEMNPFTKIGKEWMLITAGDEKKANTMTASWGGVGVLWGKNVVYIFVRDTRYTKEFIDNGETFSLTFLDESNKGALKYLGAVSGRDENKIENARMHLDYYKDTPYIDEGNLVFICKRFCCSCMVKMSMGQKDCHRFCSGFLNLLFNQLCLVSRVYHKKFSCLMIYQKIAVGADWSHDIS